MGLWSGIHWRFRSVLSPPGFSVFPESKIHQFFFPEINVYDLFILSRILMLFRIQTGFLKLLQRFSLELEKSLRFGSVQSLSHVWLCNPMHYSMPGLPVHHQLSQFRNSNPLSRWCHPTISSSVFPFSSCPQSFPTSSLFKWVGSSHQVAKVLELQHQSFQWILRVDFL